MVVCRRGAVRLVIRSSGVCFGGGGGGVLLRRFPGSSHAKTGEQGSAARETLGPRMQAFPRSGQSPCARIHRTICQLSLHMLFLTQLDLSERSNIIRLK